MTRQARTIYQLEPEFLEWARLAKEDFISTGDMNYVRQRVTERIDKSKANIKLNKKLGLA
ncbi:hypothetical protein ACIFOT_23965 [Neobacillus sp. NRS-1170]|uniref:hypothetical protein n=1 Tax=Neobacillus sp. NRS-1170 TaxID=3233898 RepID=UPI003D28CCEA